MALLNDLINQIENSDLRQKIQAEIDRINKQKKFGLVFEEHLPECTPLYDVPVRKGSRVALKNGNINDLYIVVKIEDEIAYCQKEENAEIVQQKKDDLVSVARFGEAIYPCLKKIDSICNAPDSDLWHTLIEADNYHALQLLEYLYAGKVDCIYIDPPYNTGAKDWKYNNDYVDASDTYRHSKWLSMMQKRLRIAKKLLNPEDSVLIVTIDEKEYLHLGCLLEEMFPEARIQMVSCCINPGGVSRNNDFCRTDEYIYFVKNGSAGASPLPLDTAWMGNVKNTSKNNVHWETLLRTGTNNMRADRPNLFYPVLVSEDGRSFVGVGDPLPLQTNRNSFIVPKGQKAIWPIHLDGSEGCWKLGRSTLLNTYENHFVRLGGFTERGMAINYLKAGEQEKVRKGLYKIIGIRGDNSYELDDSDYKPFFIPGTQWLISSHDASRQGSGMLRKIFNDKRFSFPKSLYAVHDTIRFFVANKPNALIVDFFAGSGTTLHAVNLLNAEDGGKRRCIMVTNNEVSDEEAKSLSSQGYHHGDDEWEKLGIAHYVTWPRTVCSIKGNDINGNPLKGNYIGSDIQMADGFKSNAVFFKLQFLDKREVALGKQFIAMIPTLWLKAGAYGECPKVKKCPDMLVLPQNRFAVLVDENYFSEFEKQVKDNPEIETIFIITNSEPAYLDMIFKFNNKTTYQLYRDYLDNFRINVGR